MNNVTLDRIESSLDRKEPIDLEIKKINLLTGMNGSGKTFILIQTWFIQMVLFLYSKIPDKDNLKKVVETMFLSAFDGDLDGDIIGKFTEDVTLTVKVSGSKIDDIILDNKNAVEISDVAPPTY